MAVLHDNTSRIQGLLNDINNLPKDRSGEAYEQGKTEGYTDGYTDGHADGVQKGYADGYENGSAEHFGTLKSMIECTGANLTIPSGVTKIGSNAFNSHSELVTVTLPEGITSIDPNAFRTCSNMTTMNLPDSLENIGGSAFAYCGRLQLTTIPPNVKTIGDYAFQGPPLTTLTFKGKPTSIATTAFYGCSGLTTINVPWAEGEVANAPWGATNATIHYNYTGE